MIGGRFRATRVDPSNSPSIASASRVANLFKAQAHTMNLPTQDLKPIKATLSENGAIATPENAAENVIEPESLEEGLEQKEDIW